MYCDPDNDNNPLATHWTIAMPSPSSKLAPYFSGRADKFENFVEEFEDLAHACKLTESQKSKHSFDISTPSPASLVGYAMDIVWAIGPHFGKILCTALVPLYHDIDPRCGSYALVKDSSRTRMTCEADIIQYCRTFMCYSLPLVHSRHTATSQKEAATAFWYRFHPIDR